MDIPTNAIKVRNLLVGVGAYYLSWFVANPLAIGIGKLTNGMTYSGDFEGGTLSHSTGSAPDSGCPQLRRAGRGVLRARRLRRGDPLRALTGMAGDADVDRTGHDG